MVEYIIAVGIALVVSVVLSFAVYGYAAFVTSYRVTQALNPSATWGDAWREMVREWNTVVREKQDSNIALDERDLNGYGSYGPDVWENPTAWDGDTDMSSDSPFSAALKKPRRTRTPKTAKTAKTEKTPRTRKPRRK